MTHHYDAALQAELDHRRTALRHDADGRRLARLVSRRGRGDTHGRRPARAAAPVE